MNRKDNGKMKRFEKFNEMFNDDESAELQAIEVVLSQVSEDFDIMIDFADYKDMYKKVLKWLNDEVKE